MHCKNQRHAARLHQATANTSVHPTTLCHHICSNHHFVLLLQVYDLAVGTSERGTVLPGPDSLKLPPYQHMLIAFGGPLGLEECVRQDPALQAEPNDPQPQKLFNFYCNTCPEQGSRTIRTEEAVLISLSYLQSAIRRPNMQQP